MAKNFLFIPLLRSVALNPWLLQILLRHRNTNLSARMIDGTTPLILAARLAVEGMIEDLLNAEADINTADDHGKSGAVSLVGLVQCTARQSAN